MSNPLRDLYGPSSSILITGASSGIGATLAEVLAEQGGRISLVARREDRLTDVAERVRARGAGALVLGADVTDPAAVAPAHARIVAEHGPVDVAFLNAGLSDYCLLPRFEAQRMRRVFEVNVFGVLHWLEALLPDMISRGRGVVAVTSSLAAGRALPGNGSYAATKAAISSLFDALRPEARAFGVQLTIVEPGFVKSEMTDQVTIPMPFLMETEEAARRIARGVAEGETRIRFPWQMAAAMQVLRHLPSALYDRLGAQLIRTRKKRRPPSRDRGPGAPRT